MASEPPYYVSTAIICGTAQRSLMEQAGMSLQNPEGELVLVYVKPIAAAPVPEGAVGLLPTKPRVAPKVTAKKARSKKR